MYFKRYILYYKSNTWKFHIKFLTFSSFPHSHLLSSEVTFPLLYFLFLVYSFRNCLCTYNMPLYYIFIWLPFVKREHRLNYGLFSILQLDFFSLDRISWTYLHTSLILFTCCLELQWMDVSFFPNQSPVNVHLSLPTCADIFSR